MRDSLYAQNFLSRNRILINRFDLCRLNDYNIFFNSNLQLYFIGLFGNHLQYYFQIILLVTFNSTDDDDDDDDDDCHHEEFVVPENYKAKIIKKRKDRQIFNLT